MGDESKSVTVEGIFEDFVGKDCDGREFAKLCKDCSLYDRGYKTVDTDIIFAKVVPKGQRRMNYDMFKHAVAEIAVKKGKPTEAVQDEIIAAGGPKWNATQADHVSFHDDKSLYTGAHAAVHGGGAGERTSADRQARLAASDAPTDMGDEELFATKIAGIFYEFVGNDCDGREFAKFCRDCNLYDQGYKRPDTDIIFAKVVPRGQRRMDFGMFKLAVAEIAQKKGKPTATVQEEIIAAGGPKWNATETEYVAFHDDKSLYTGMHHGK